MTSAQTAAFQAGSGVSPDTLLVGIASVVLVLTFVWVMWITFGAFRGWQSGAITAFDFLWGVLRASIILSVLGFYLR
jgi:integrating conjugative element protein (TIGR03758 family)